MTPAPVDPAAPSFTSEEVGEPGEPRCVRVANAHIELSVATQFGPRILGFAPLGGSNVLGSVPSSDHIAGKTSNADGFRLYGGHRLWAAPEEPRTYAPDNEPVRWDHTTEGVRVSGPEDAAGLVKELVLTLDAAGPRVRVLHRITNTGQPTELAPWALSLLRPGGVALVPNAPYIQHPTALLPSRTLVLWPYTWLGDPRFRWGRRFARLAHDAGQPEPQKMGAFVEQGFAAYAVAGTLFVKRFPVGPGIYPDKGCNFEVFADSRFLELESLGPLVRLGTGETVEHEEVWSVHRDIGLPEDDEETAELLDRLLAKRWGEG